VTPPETPGVRTYLDAYREAQKWCGIDDSDGPQSLVAMIRNLGEQAERLSDEIDRLRAIVARVQDAVKP
jgi:hypothetical protein